MTSIKLITTPYVIAEDLQLILKKWARERGFKLPKEDFFISLREEMKQELRKIFPRVEFVNEAKLLEGLKRSAILHQGPLISLEKVYVENPPIAIEITRMIGEDLEPLSEGSRSHKPLDYQAKEIAERLGGKLRHSVTILDDAIMSGNTLMNVIEKLRDVNIHVTHAVGGVVTEEAERRLTNAFPHIKISSVAHFPTIIGEVQHERDFYAGVPFSGRLIGKRGLPLNPETGAPYFLPFGKPTEWGSIPEEHAKQWSLFCLNQSILLWLAIEEASGKEVRSKDLARTPKSIPSDDSRFIEHLKRVLKS